MAPETIDITPTAAEQANILELMAASILSDVRKARRDANVQLLRAVVDLAFTAGFNAASHIPSDPFQSTATAAIATRTKLEDRIR